MAADSVRFERALHKILWQLRQCLGDLVLIGGWVPHLYRRHGGFRDWTLETPLTSEVDLLIVPPLPIAESVTEVLNSAGFRPLNDRDAAAVWVKDPESGEQVEFLVAHSGTGRQIGRFRVPGQKGLGAISLEGSQSRAVHESNRGSRGEVRG